MLTYIRYCNGGDNTDPVKIFLGEILNIEIKSLMAEIILRVHPNSMPKKKKNINWNV